MTNFLEIWLRRALFTTDQKTCCGKQKNISCEKLAQKLTIQSRIVNVLDTTLRISTIKIFFKTLDKRVLLLYFCNDIEINLFT
jgi:hypothetical protein